MVGKTFVLKRSLSFDCLFVLKDFCLKIRLQVLRSTAPINSFNICVRKDKGAIYGRYNVEILNDSNNNAFIFSLDM